MSKSRSQSGRNSRRSSERAFLFIHYKEQNNMNKPKLTREKYEMIENQYFVTPDTRKFDYDLTATGSHYMLMHILNQVGVRVYTREEALDEAEKIINGEYEHVGW